MTDLLRRRPEPVALLLVLPVLVLLPGSTPLGVYGLGVVSSATLALHAAGIVLVFRSNRFLDFAQISIGAVAGTLFALLVNAQPVFRAVAAICPPCLERVTPAEQRASYWASLAVALGVSVLLGWLIYVLVVRRLDGAPRLVVTVASLFLVTLLAGLQKLLVNVLTNNDQQLLGGMTNAVPPPVSWSFRIGPAQFGLPQVLLVVVAVLSLAGTALYLQRSSTGTAIRAAAESASRAQTLGIDVGRVTGRVWMLVGLLSGLASVLSVMSAPAGNGDDPGLGTALVRVLLVVVVARLVSLPMVAVGALAMGVLTAAVQFSVRSTSWLDGALVLVVSGLLLVQRGSERRVDSDSSSAYLTGRQARPVPRALAELPTVRGLRRGGAGVAVVVLLGLPFVLSPSQTSSVTTTLLLAVAGMSLLVLTGWAGLVSLGQFAFAAVGAWTAAASGLPFPLAVLLGVLAGAAVAVAVGLPALRLQPLTLAVSTLAFAAAVPAVLLNPDAFGRALPEELPRPLLLGVRLDSQRSFYYLALVVLALVVGAVAGLRRSRTARALLAGRDNEAAAQSFGISLLRARLQAFALSGGAAALAGALFAYQQTGVKTESFAVGASLLVFTFTVIGGLGSVGGPLAGFALLAVLNLTVAGRPTVLALVNGFGGLVLLLAAPGGLAQVLLDVRDGVLRRIARRNGIAVPGLDRGPTEDAGVAPIVPKTRAGGGTVFVPQTYALDGDWAAPARRPR